MNNYLWIDYDMFVINCFLLQSGKDIVIMFVHTFYHLFLWEGINHSSFSTFLLCFVGDDKEISERCFSLSVCICMYMYVNGISIVLYLSSLCKVPSQQNARILYSRKLLTLFISFLFETVNEEANMTIYVNISHSFQMNYIIKWSNRMRTDAQFMLRITAVND